MQTRRAFRQEFKAKVMLEYISASEACRLQDYPRSSYYHAPRVKDENQRQKQAIQTMAGEWPTYGYREITPQLNQQGWKVNHKRVNRFMRQMGIQRVKKALFIFGRRRISFGNISTRGSKV